MDLEGESVKAHATRFEVLPMDRVQHQEQVRERIAFLERSVSSWCKWRDEAGEESVREMAEQQVKILTAALEKERGKLRRLAGGPVLPF